MKQIPLTQGKVALIDDEDFERISKHKWFARKQRNTWYALRTPYPEGGSVLMHREIIGTPKGIGTDHWDGNGLNNQKYNLRKANQTKNGQSFRRLRLNKMIRFRGVTPKRNKFRARITVNGQEVNLGVFETPEMAAQAYDSAAANHFGEFAHLNFV